MPVFSEMDTLYFPGKRGIAYSPVVFSSRVCSSPLAASTGVKTTLPLPRGLPLRVTFPFTTARFPRGLRTSPQQPVSATRARKNRTRAGKRMIRLQLQTRSEEQDPATASSGGRAWDQGGADQKLTVSPPSAVQIARNTWALIELVMNCTCPSPKTACTPPELKLNGSSLGPQLFADQGQDVGPPLGVALLLIRAVLFTVSWCGPETPLATSGSPHR